MMQSYDWDCDFSHECIHKMRCAIRMSHFKYGRMSDDHRKMLLVYLHRELDAFGVDRNLEHLVNVANYAMLRWKHCEEGEVHVGTDSSGSIRCREMSVVDWIRRHMEDIGYA